MLFIQPTRELEPCDDDDDWFMGMDIYSKSNFAGCRQIHGV